MNKSFRNLFNKKWSVRDLEFNVCLDLFKVSLKLGHFFACRCFGDVTLLFKSICITDNSRRTFDSLLKSVLSDETFNIFLKFILLLLLVILHVSASRIYIGIMLLCGRGLLCVLIALDRCFDRVGTVFRFKRGINCLIRFVHISA